MPEAIVRSQCVTRLSRPLDPVSVERALEIAESGFYAATPPAFDHVPQRSDPLSILVADDNRTNQMVLSKMLGLANHKVRLVDDGEAALDALEEEEFDLVLMDVNMPVLNGIDATKLYRFSAIGHKAVPIVALTADAFPDTRRRCAEAGMVACMAKPVDAEELLAMISEILTGAESETLVPILASTAVGPKAEPLLAHAPEQPECRARRSANAGASRAIRRQAIRA